MISAHVPDPVELGYTEASRVAAVVTTLVKLHGGSNASAGAALGVSNTLVSVLRRGGARVVTSLSTLEKVAALAGCTVADLRAGRCTLTAPPGAKATKGPIFVARR